MRQLSANNFEVEHESKSDDSQIVIINTCGFIESAKQESIDTIIRYAEERKSGSIEKLYVTGCLSERYKPELEKEIKGVDSFFGTRDLPRLLKTLKADYRQELVGERLLTTPAHYAYFKISEGCDRVCSFCAIPLMRGKHVSVPIEELVNRASNLAKQGVVELILIAQDLTFYGFDIYKKRNLAELLDRLSDVNGIEWIRLHYAFPSGFPLDVLEVINNKKNICKYLDMPLQHISDSQLALMRRGITKQKTIDLVRRIRESVPGIALRTTMLVGFPGETEQDFDELKEFVSDSKFDRLGVFAYSHEEGTHGYTMQDMITAKIKEKRVEELMAIQHGISLELNNARIGSVMKVLFDRKESGYFVGRTEFDSPEVDNEVLVDAEKNYVRLGDFSKVRIKSAEAFDLHAELSEQN